jgi:hypothetical protein
MAVLVTATHVFFLSRQAKTTRRGWPGQARPRRGRDGRRQRPRLSGPTPPCSGGGSAPRARAPVRSGWEGPLPIEGGVDGPGRADAIGIDNDEPEPVQGQPLVFGQGCELVVESVGDRVEGEVMRLHHVAAVRAEREGMLLDRITGLPSTVTVKSTKLSFAGSGRT